MSTQVVSVGGELLIKGIRHLNNHESVLCVLHVDEGDFIPDESNNVLEDSVETKHKRKVSSGKSVHFNVEETRFQENDSCERSSTSSSNYSEESSGSEQKMPILSGNDDRSSSVESPRVTRKKKGSLKPSPLLKDTTERTGENSPKMGKNSPASQRKSVDKLGLSPRIRRKGSAKAPSIDGLSTSSKSEKKHSWPLANGHGDFTQAPLHSGFIGSEEELEKLKFIKTALSPLPAPISPEQFRSRSSTFGEESNRQTPSVTFRERSSTLDNGSNKKEVYSKYNKLTLKVQEANKPRKPRYGSAH